MRTGSHFQCLLGKLDCLPSLVSCLLPPLVLFSSLKRSLCLQSTPCSPAQNPITVSAICRKGLCTGGYHSPTHQKQSNDPSWDCATSRKALQTTSTDISYQPAEVCQLSCGLAGTSIWCICNTSCTIETRFVHASDGVQVPSVRIASYKATIPREGCATCSVAVFGLVCPACLRCLGGVERNATDYAHSSLV